MSHGQRMLRAEARRRREEEGLPSGDEEDNDTTNVKDTRQKSSSVPHVVMVSSSSANTTPVKKGSSLLREDGYLRENSAFPHEARTPSRGIDPRPTASPSEAKAKANVTSSLTGLMSSPQKSGRSNGPTPLPLSTSPSRSANAMPQKKRSRTAGQVTSTTTTTSKSSNGVVVVGATSKKRLRPNSHSVSPPPVTSRATDALAVASKTFSTRSPQRGNEERRTTAVAVSATSTVAETQKRPDTALVQDVSTQGVPLSRTAVTTTMQSHSFPLASRISSQDENSSSGLVPCSPPLRAAVSPRTLPTQPNNNASSSLYAYSELGHMRLEQAWRPHGTLPRHAMAEETGKAGVRTQNTRLQQCVSPSPSPPPPPSTTTLLGESQKEQQGQRSSSRGSEARVEREARPLSRPASHSPPFTVEKMHYGDKAWQRGARTATGASTTTTAVSTTTRSAAVTGQVSGKRARSERPSPRELNMTNTTAITSEMPSAPIQQQPAAMVKPAGQPSSTLPMPETYPASSLALLESDCSGFANIGNDCYACSVLTMLLRSPRFRRELARSPYMQLLRRYETLHAARLQGTMYDPSELHRLRLMLQMGQRKGKGVAPTVHAALAGFIAAQQRREALRFRLTHEANTVADRVRLIRDVLRLDKAADFTQVVHNFCDGVSLAPLVPFFDDVFFTGAQEDAHELLVCLIAKLEQECMDFARHYQAVLTSNSPDGDHTANTSASLTLSTTPLANTQETQEGKEVEGAKTETATEGTTRKEDTSMQLLPPVPTSIWINDLLQGRLLNIVRCRNAQCGHEIVTLEPYVNVSASIESQGTAVNSNTQPSASSPSVVTTNSHDVVSVDEACDLLESEAAGAATETMPAMQSATNITTSDAAAAVNTLPQPAISDSKGTATSANAVQASSEQPPLLSQLLRRSVRYTPLEGYKCDVCGSEANQYQGGCFYGTPPPILIVQVKRFLQRFTSEGRVVFTKVHAAVRVDDPLVVYALPDKADIHPEESDKEDDVYYDAEGKCFTAALHAKERAARQAAQPLTESDETSSDTTSSYTSSSEEDKEEDERSKDRSACFIRAIRAVYRLQGTVLHLGPNLSSGHYVAEFAISPTNTTAETATSTNGASTEAATITPSKTVDAAQQQKKSTPSVWRLADNAFVHDENTVAEAAARRGTYAASRNKRCYLALYEKVSETIVRCPLWRVLPNARHLPQVQERTTDAQR